MVATIAPLVKVASTQWLYTTAIFVISSTGAGAVAGSLCGLVGQILFGSSAPAASAYFLAGTALALASLDTRVLGARVPSLGGSVPRSWWERYGPLRAALMYGSVLGTGASTLVPIASFYLLPVASLLMGSSVGALIGGTYGFARALAVPVASVGEWRGAPLPALTEWLLRDGRRIASVASATALIALAVAALV